jgi:two-component system, LuxR family, secretion system response regulator SsrB
LGHRRGDAESAALTPRQRQILHFVLQGMTNGEIAGELRLSRRTVEVHRLNMMHRLNAHNIAQLFRQAMALGLAKDLHKPSGARRERKNPDRR